MPDTQLHSGHAAVDQLMIDWLRKLRGPKTIILINSGGARDSMLPGHSQVNYLANQVNPFEPGPEKIRVVNDTYKKYRR